MRCGSSSTKYEKNVIIVVIHASQQKMMMKVLEYNFTGVQVSPDLANYQDFTKLFTDSVDRLRRQICALKEKWAPDV